MSPEALAIRDAAAARFAGQVGPAPKLFRMLDTTPVELEPDDQLPSLLIIATREQMSADGDANAGEPSFVVNLTLAFLISLAGTDRARVDDRLSTRVAAVLSLLNDPGFVSLVEGFAGITSIRRFEKDGERFFGRASVEMTVQYRLSFPPVVPDDYLGATLTVRPLTNPNAPPITVRLDQSDD